MNYLPPFQNLKIQSYSVLLSDPPWAFKSYSKKDISKMPDAHYICQDIDWIKNLPVQALMKEDSVSIMWGTAPMLPECIETMEAWGFKYKTAGAWGKLSKNSIFGQAGNKLAFGTGYLYRSAAEFWILGTRGNPKSKSKSIRNLILAPVREHSRKPDQMKEMIEEQFDGPYLELFGRESRENWDVWGNESNKFDKKEQLEMIL